MGETSNLTWGKEKNKLGPCQHKQDGASPSHRFHVLTGSVWLLRYEESVQGVAKLGIGLSEGTRASVDAGEEIGLEGRINRLREIEK